VNPLYLLATFRLPVIPLYLLSYCRPKLQKN
jgi:hypothetical protein